MTGRSSTRTFRRAAAASPLLPQSPLLFEPAADHGSNPREHAPVQDQPQCEAPSANETLPERARESDDVVGARRSRRGPSSRRRAPGSRGADGRRRPAECARKRWHRGHSKTGSRASGMLESEGPIERDKSGATGDDRQLRGGDGSRDPGFAQPGRRWSSRDRSPCESCRALGDYSPRAGPDERGRASTDCRDRTAATEASRGDRACDSKAADRDSEVARGSRRAACASAERTTPSGVRSAAELTRREEPGSARERRTAVD